MREINILPYDSLAHTTVGPPSIPTNTSFSEYLSCNGNRQDPSQKLNYTCVCDNRIDRVIAHQTPEQLAMYCNSSTWQPTQSDVAAYFDGDTNISARVRQDQPCHCDSSSVAYSSKYTGIMPVSLPWMAHHHGSPTPSPLPTPAPSPPIHFGNWYHHPAATKCKEVGFGEETIGTDGCTWRRHPAAFMAYGQDLLNAGWNFSTAAIRQNAEVFAGVFKELSSGRCCGC